MIDQPSIGYRTRSAPVASLLGVVAAHVSRGSAEQNRFLFEKSQLAIDSCVRLPYLALATRPAEWSDVCETALRADCGGANRAADSLVVSAPSFAELSLFACSCKQAIDQSIMLPYLEWYHKLIYRNPIDNRQLPYLLVIVGLDELQRAEGGTAQAADCHAT